MTAPNRWAKAIVHGLCFFYLSGCGYSQQEWDAQLRNAQDLSTKLQEQKRAAAKCVAQSDDSRRELEKLQHHLVQRGIRLDRLADDLERQKIASQEYNLRLGQLDALDSQVKELQERLNPLQERGIRLVERNNLLAIRIPTESILLPDGAGLSGAGQQLLRQVASALRDTGSLAMRNFQVAAHTDREHALPTGYSNQWALSAAQAHKVAESLSTALASLGHPKATSVSAAGFGATDPIARNDSPAERRRNERIELVALPLAEERLNLSGLNLLR